MTVRKQALAVAAIIVSCNASSPASEIGYSAETRAALPVRGVAKIGAAVAFAEYEAENASTNGIAVGPDRLFTTVAAEASGRRAVRLEARGDYVEFTLARAANAVSVRAAVPDARDGKGMDATLSVAVDGLPAGRLSLSSRYGWFYGAYPFTNSPADGRPHHVFDEARLMFGRTLPAGTRVRFHVGEGDRAPWYAIDLADFELVPAPAPAPANSVSVIAFGADPTGRRSSSDAFDRGVAAARAREAILWIPPGRFLVDRHIIVDRVRIRGAGPWHSIVGGDGVGFYGKPAPEGSTGVELSGFAILGEVVDRVDDAQHNAIGGAMNDSLIEDLLVQHHKVGLWFDGPMRGIRIRRLRVTDCTADGLNFRRRVSDAVVEDSLWRNTGDDALAAWSHREANHHIVFRRNTIVAPILANGIAIYGGHDIIVAGNLIADTVTEGGGLHLGNRFDAVPASGSIRFVDNVVVRSGSFDPRWRFGVGALWLYALDAPMRARVRVERTALLDSSEDAVLFLGKPITGVTLDRVRIDGGGRPAVVTRSEGSATIRDSRVRGTATPAWLRCLPGFALKRVATPALAAAPGTDCRTVRAAP